MIEWLKKHMLPCTVLIVLPFFLYIGPLLESVLLGKGDLILNISQSTLLKDGLLNGEIPLWNGYVMGGSPYLEDIGVGVLYPLKWLLIWLPTPIYANMLYLVSLSLAGIFSYFYLNELTANRWIAFFGGIAFALSNVIGGYRKEHVAVYSTIIWLPLMLLYVLKYSRTHKKRYIVATAVIMAIQFLAGFPQYNLYSYAVVYLYLIYSQWLQKRKLKKIIIDILMLSVLLISYSAIQLIPAIGLVLSSRGTSTYFDLFSNSPSLLLMTIFPHIFSDLYNPLGANSAEISTELYYGVIPLIYATYAIRHNIRNKDVRFFTAILILTLVHSSAAHIPIYGDVVRKIPIINMFGVQSRILFLSNYSIIILGALGLMNAFEAADTYRLLRWSCKALLSFIFIMLVSIAITTYPTSYAQNEYMMTSLVKIFGKTLLIALCNYIILLSYEKCFVKKNRVKYKEIAVPMIILILTIITATDLWEFSKVFYAGNFNEIYNTEVVNELKTLKDIEDVRVAAVYEFDNTYYSGAYSKSGLVDNRSIYNKIRNINGWMEFENVDLNTLLEKTESRDPSGINKDIGMRNDILSMMGVKYVLLPNDVDLPIDVTNGTTVRLLDSTEPIGVTGDGELFVYSYPIALESNSYYEVQMEIDSKEGFVPELFYIDFWGNDYDSEAQQEYLLTNDQNIKRVIFSGDIKNSEDQKYFRIVGKSNENFEIKHFQVSIYEDSKSDNMKYKQVAKTADYNIYENTKAKELINVPDTVISHEIQAFEALTLNDLHIESYADIDEDILQNEISVNDIKYSYNTVSFHTTSNRKGFVNLSYSFNDNWKCYIDGVQTKVYKVNGVIMGVEIPSGTHDVKFKYWPLSLSIGLSVTFLSLICTVFVYVKNRMYRKNITNSV